MGAPGKRTALHAVLLPALCLYRHPSAAQAPGDRDAAVAGIANVVAAGAKWELAWQGTNNADGLVGLDDGTVLFAREQPRLIGRRFGGRAK